ncbi:MAG: hypothetical protein LBD64_08380 [Odoribacteraceae bacterium]|jgi:hypothetical protein|nr:hypothetical protein [Odoribacteraceae bacterium]
MKEELLVECFVEMVRLRLAPGTNLATYLMEILCIGKEAVYRRLRGDVAFTFDEIVTVSKKLKISLDELSGEQEPVFIPFYLSRTREDDEKCPVRDKKDLAALLEKAKSSRDPDSEAGIALNTLSVVLMRNYPQLMKFRVFKWLYQRAGGDAVKPYDTVVVPRSLILHGEEKHLSLAGITNISLILDKMVFAHVINDVRAFALIGLLSREDVRQVKEDIAGLLDELERIATTGQNPMGNRLDLFLSDISFESTYSYTTTRRETSCAIGIFSMDMMYSVNKRMYFAVKHWVDSLKQYSFLITKSGGIHRRQFFNAQREMLETL